MTTKHNQAVAATTLSTGEVAAMLGYSKPTIRKLTQQQTDPLPCTRLPAGRTHRRFRKSDVEAWIVRNTTGSRADV